MTDRPRTYSDQFKADALNLVETSGKSVAQVARELGISQWALQNWVKKARQDAPVLENDHELSAGRLMVDNVEQPAFTLATDPPPLKVGEADQIRGEAVRRPAFVPRQRSQDASPAWGEAV